MNTKKTILAALAASLIGSTAYAGTDIDNTFYVKLSDKTRLNATKTAILERGASLLPLAGDLKVEKVILGDWLVVKAVGARTLSDVRSLGSRVASLPGVGLVNYPANKRMHAVTSSSFNDPAWPAQFPYFSGAGGSATRAGRMVSPQFDLVLDRYASISQNIIFGVIDEGYHRSVDFEGRVLSERDYVEGTVSMPTENATPNGETCENRAGLHGEHVASVIGAAANNGFGAVGLAPNAKFHMARVFNCSGSFSFGGYLEAFEYMASLPEAVRPSVLNLSLGDVLQTNSKYPECSSIEQDAVTLAVEAGIFVVASAGNDGRLSDGTTLPAPASCVGAISVGAVDNGGRYTKYSSTAPTLTISTYGGGHSSGDGRDGFTGDLELFAVTDAKNESTVNVTQGTSFSSPAAAAILGYARQLDPTLTPIEAATLLQQTGYKATSETDPRCNNDACYSLKASDFLAAVAGEEPTPEPNPNPNPNPNPSPEPEPNPNPNPSPEPEPTPEPAPGTPVSNQVNVENFAGGFDDICEISVPAESGVTISVSGGSAQCGTATASPSASSGQIVTISGPVGRDFTPTIRGFRPNSTSQITATPQMRVTSTGAEVTAPSNDQAVGEQGNPGAQAAAGGGGGGGSLNLFGLLGLALLAAANRFTKRS